MNLASWGLVLGVIAVLALVWLVYMLATAPEGYEDQNGFHKTRGK